MPTFKKNKKIANAGEHVCVGKGSLHTVGGNEN
jgi:hypothetical protein